MRQGAQTTTVQPGQTGTPSDDMGQFVGAILAGTETVWSEVLPREKGVPYTKPTLVLYSGRTASGCGGASRPWGLSIARGIGRSISIRPSSRI